MVHAQVAAPAESDIRSGYAHVAVDEALARIESADAGRPSERVTILGSGAAGVLAPLELQGLGPEVAVLEGSGHIDGGIPTRAEGTSAPALSARGPPIDP